MKQSLLLSGLLSLCLLSACGLTRTDYAQPSVALPETWAEAETAHRVGGAWWKLFGDEKLNALIDEAVAKNNDLAVAAFKVRQAQLKADLATDQLLPDWSGSGSFSNAQNLRGHPEVERSHKLSTSVSYEVDLWGKIAAQSDAASWEARATEQDRASAEIALIGTVAKLYWKTAYFNERIALSEQSIAYTQKTLDLALVRHKAGADSAIEEAAARQSLAEQEAAHTQFLQQRTETLNAFAILFDAPPGARANTFAPLPRMVPSLAAGLPAELLGRRPDLRAAEMRLREALATEDATRASYLPSFTLTGSLDSSSIALVDVMKNPVGTLGAGIALPFLNLYDMKKNVEISETAYEQAVAGFRQTLYAALADVENALAARRNDAEQGRKLDEALVQARKKETLLATQYKAGYVKLQEWLDAQEKRRAAEASALDNAFTRLSDAVTLYEALGGEASLPAYNAK